MVAEFTKGSLVCGATGCTDAADVVINHTEHGKRVVCETHADDYEVIVHV